MSSLSRRAALKGSAALSIMGSAACGRRAAPSASDELSALDAVATAQKIKAGDANALEVVNAAIDRAEQVNPQINAIVTPYYESARERAAAPPSGPWAGVPTFIKDLTNVIGQRTTYGARGFANHIAAAQSPLVDSLFSNGLISLGKSASPEFGLNATTEPALNGPTRNPWNLNHSVGGSSGGAAALVAAGVTPIAHASDGGGSIRIPASCCGVVGLKATRARMPSADKMTDQPIVLTEQGAVTRTVRDTAAFLAMMEQDGPLEKVGLVSGPGAARRAISFFTKAPSGVETHPDVVAVIEETAAKLDGLGHRVKEIAPPFNAGVLQDFTIYWGAGAARIVELWEEQMGRKADYGSFEPFTYGMIDYYQMRRETLPEVIHRLATFERDYRALFSDADILLSPVLAAPPPLIGHLSTLNAFPIVFERLSAYVAFTQFANIAGAPALSLPMGVSASALPIGAHLAGASGAERMLLELAYELEEAAPWRDRRPEIYA